MKEKKNEYKLLRIGKEIIFFPSTAANLELTHTINFYKALQQERNKISRK